MGIDAKRIGLCLWKCLKLPIITSSKYPFVWGTLVLLLLVYIFLPSAFIIVACSSPFLALADVVVQFYFKSKPPKSKNVKVVSIKDDDIIFLRNDGTPISRQMSRRRNFKDKNKLGRGARSERDDLVSLTETSIRELLGLAPETEDKPKVLLEVNEIGSLDNKDGSNARESLWKPDFMSHSSSDEQRRNIGGKVEIEDRNKRLEILIAKRRARKLMKLQDGESPVDADMDNAPWPELEIAPVLVSRADRFDHFPRVDTLMPSSAPPILLPTTNPFDLPYDPLEERPNLRGDSFHDEFTMTRPMDKFLCRHESLSLGSFFKLEPRKAERVGYPRCIGQPKGRSMSPKLSSQDHIEEEKAPIQETKSVQLQHEEGKESKDITTQNQLEGVGNSQNVESGLSKHEEDKETEDITTQNQVEGVGNSQNVESGLSEQSKIEVKTNATDTKHNESSASSSSSASNSSDEDHIYNANIAGVSVSLTSKGRNFPNMIQTVKSPLACSTPKKKDSHNLSAADKAKREEFFYVGRSHHAHSYSLASDMQVEVSEDGSPPPIDNEAFSVDGEIEKEINSGGEDKWGPSTSIDGIEKQQSNSGVHDSGEEAKTEALSSRAYMCSVDPVASVTEISEKGQPNLKESDDKIHDKENISFDEESKRELDTLISQEAAEDTSSRIIEGETQNVAEKISSVNNPGTSTDKVPTTQSNIVHNLNETLMSQIMNEEKLQSVGNGELESKASTMQEPIPELLTNVVGGDIEGKSQHSSDSNQSVNGEPECLAIVEEHIAKPLTSTDESSSKTTKKY